MSEGKIVELKTSTDMAAEAAANEEAITEIDVTMSTGAIVRVKMPKTKVLYKLYKDNPAPKVPTFMNTEGGKSIEMENPDDPDYIQAKAEYQSKVYDAYSKLIVLTSTEILKYPDGQVPFDEDKEWIEDFEAIGISTDFVNRKARWLEWFFYRIAVTQEDMLAIQEASAKLQGVEEEEVDSATENTFQDKR